MDMQQKIDQVVAVLQQAVRDYAPVCFANSLGAEDMVLTDIIANHHLDIEMFSLDTGRLPQATYDLSSPIIIWISRCSAWTPGACRKRPTT